MKIIASDYDGTLNHGGIDDAKRDAIKRWRKAGNLFGIVSGRGPSDLVDLHKRNNFECDFLLASNGAVIMDSEGRILAESRCDSKLAKPLIEFLMNNGCSWACIHSDADYDIGEREDGRNENCLPLELMPEIAYFNQINTILPDDEQAEKVTDAVKNAFGDYLNPLQNGRCIDIISADMNKAQGLYSLLRIVGAEYDDMITVGDNINDTHMIAEFRSYAMENAVQAIKDIADYETHGITELIEKEMGM